MPPHRRGLPVRRGRGVEPGGRVPPQSPSGRPGNHLDDGRLGEVTLDLALIDRPQQGVAVLLRECRGQGDVDPDPVHMLSGASAVRRHRDHQAFGVEVALLQESERVVPGARPDRGEEEVEGRRGRSLPPRDHGLVRPDAVSLVDRLDPQASRKGDVPWSRRLGPAARAAPDSIASKTNHFPPLTCRRRSEMLRYRFVALLTLSIFCAASVALVAGAARLRRGRLREALSGDGGRPLEETSKRAKPARSSETPRGRTSRPSCSSRARRAATRRSRPSNPRSRSSWRTTPRRRAPWPL